MLLISVEHMIYLYLSLLDQVIENLALHLKVAHDTCGLQIFEQYNALKPDLILIVTFLTVIHALISTNQIIKNEAQIITQVFIVLINDYLVVAGELNFIVLDKLRQISD